MLHQQYSFQWQNTIIFYLRIIYLAGKWEIATTIIRKLSYNLFSTKHNITITITFFSVQHPMLYVIMSVQNIEICVLYAYRTKIFYNDDN